MATGQPTIRDKTYSGIMFVVVSVLSGVLLSGLVVPFAAMAGSLAKSTAQMMEKLPVDLELPPQWQGSRILLADGSQLAYLADEDRVYVPLNQINPIMQKAQVAIEDHRFYQHGALDFRSLMRAVLKSGGEQGGSSLTQQYVKQVQIMIAKGKGDKDGVAKAQERTLARKIRELRYAVALEHTLSKDQILERYLNIAYYGDGSYGVEAAARHYFQTTAKDLTLPQAALLAGMVKAPGNDPVHQPRLALERRDVVLDRMASPDIHIITQAEADAAKATKFDATKVTKRTDGCVGTRFPHVCDYTVRELLKTPSLGATPADRDAAIRRGGFTFQITINPAFQEAAEANLQTRYAAADPVIAVQVVIKPGTGDILVMAQNKNRIGTNTAAGETFYNYAVPSDMGGAEGYQAGSTFKGFTVAAAIDKGIPTSRVFTNPVKDNYGGRTFESCDGPFISPDYPVADDDLSTPVNLTMGQGAMWSANTFFVNLSRVAGLCRVASIQEAAGIKLADPDKSLTKEYSHYPSLTLGIAEVTPMSMANAYATLAGHGVRCNTVITRSITGPNGKKYDPLPTNCTQAIRKEVADGTADVLQTGPKTSRLYQTGAVPGYPFAAKTGTTEYNDTTWFDAFTPDFAMITMATVDKTNPYWKTGPRFTDENGISKPTLKGALMSTGFSGTGYPADVIELHRLTASLIFPTGPNTPFTKPSDEVVNGKKVQTPNCTGNPTADEAALKAAGFSTGVQRIYDSTPAGTYLCFYPRGQISVGTQVDLVYSLGPAPKPTATPTPPSPAPPTPAPPTKKPT